MDAWSDREVALINEVEIFRLKPGIMKKAEGRLMALRDALVEELAGANLVLPPETDVSKGQIARGENHKGFPFVSLDMPQKFSRQEMFTYRVLFWWGHCLAFSFILKGEGLDSWLSNIVLRKGGAGDICFSLGPTPWEWELNDRNYSLLSTAREEELKSGAGANQYIKLARFRPVSGGEFGNLDWVGEGLNAFRAMTGLFMA